MQDFEKHDMNQYDSRINKPLDLVVDDKVFLQCGINKNVSAAVKLYLTQRIR
jgi:hypothetical protein